jgi:WD40 repeat protein
MKNGRLAILSIVVALVGAACGGAATAPTAVPSGTPAPTSAPTAAPAATATAAATPTTAHPSATPTGEMTHGRSYYPATPLDDGRVLVAGGYFDRYPITAADLYDPTTGTFGPTGSLATARGFDTATRLADGRVLFVGGDPSAWNFDGPYLASAELYEPTSGTFSPTGSLTTGRNMHTATLLLDGRVLIAGGNVSGQHPLASAELYDPTTRTFTATGSLVAARGFHTATLLADGRVLIAGGTSDGWVGDHFLASAEIYDPKTGKFTATGPMTDKRGNHTATRLPDGRVLITGGTATGGTSLASAEIYDPKTGKFTATGSMTAARTFQEATLLLDGRVLVSGGDPAGWNYDGPFLASAEIYDPLTTRFAATGSMMDTLTNHTATLLPDGRVLIAGGYDGKADVASAELYDPRSGTFTLIDLGG